MNSVRLSFAIQTVGSEGGGLDVVSKRLAAFLTDSGDIQVELVRLNLNLTSFCDMIRLFQQARHYGKGRIMVVQYSPWHWGGGSRATRILRVLLVLVPLIRKSIVLLHDTERLSFEHDRRVESVILILHTLFARKVVCLSRIEFLNLRFLGRLRRVVLLPHYIEDLPVRFGPTSSEGDPVAVGVVGFLHERKDPMIAVDILGHLPQGSTLTFIGPSERGSLTEKVQLYASQMGLENQVTITGYLDDADFVGCLGTIDVGLAIYRASAASGSIGSLLGSKRPVVASDLPTFREYARSGPAAVRLVTTYDPRLIAEEVVRLATTQDWRHDLQHLLGERSPDVFVKAFLRLVRS